MQSVLQAERPRKGPQRKVMSRQYLGEKELQWTSRQIMLLMVASTTALNRFQHDLGILSASGRK